MIAAVSVLKIFSPKEIFSAEISSNIFSSSACRQPSGHTNKIKDLEFKFQISFSSLTFHFRSVFQY